MKIHKLCKLFPELQGADFKSLVKDIKANGLRQPITTLDGAILDGQNRFYACKAAKVNPSFDEFSGNDPLAFIISQNLNRRQLTDDQRAAIAAEIAKMKPGQNRVADSATLPPTIEEAAKSLKVSKRKVSLAKTVKKESPLAFKKVKAGKLSLNAAHEKKHPRKKPLDRSGAATAAMQPPMNPVLPPDACPAVIDRLPNADSGPAPEVAIATVADALAFCRTTDEPGGNWETAAMMLAPEVERLHNLLRQHESNEKAAVAIETAPLTPAQLYTDLVKRYAPRIPDTMPQAEREKFGEQIIKMATWLMNPVQKEKVNFYSR